MIGFQSEQSEENGYEEKTFAIYFDRKRRVFSLISHLFSLQNPLKIDRGERNLPSEVHTMV